MTRADLPLYRELLTDPATMAELGGPPSEGGLKGKLRSIVDEVARGEACYSLIAPGNGEDPVEDVCIWEHTTMSWASRSARSAGWSRHPIRAAVSQRRGAHDLRCNHWVLAPEKGP